MNSSVFEKLRYRLQIGEPGAIRDLLVECEPFCMSKLKQKAKCTRNEAEQILEEALLIFREKVLSEKIVAVPNIKEYIFLTCWEIWREKKGKKGEEEDIKTIFYEIARHRYPREVRQEIREGDSRYYEKAFEASRWAYDRLEEKGKQVLMLYYHHKCSFKNLADLLQLTGAEEAKALKSHYYDLWMNEVEYLLMDDRI